MDWYGEWFIRKEVSAYYDMDIKEDYQLCSQEN